MPTTYACPVCKKRGGPEFEQQPRRGWVAGTAAAFSGEGPRHWIAYAQQAQAVSGVVCSWECLAKDAQRRHDEEKPPEKPEKEKKTK